MLMLPTIIADGRGRRYMVPTEMREAAIGMGSTDTMVMQRALPDRRPGILTGIMLAVARDAGETAPLLFTALFSDYWLTAEGADRSRAPSLAVLIYTSPMIPFPNQIEIAWAASLVLVSWSWS